jgi:hypothetical protein
LQNKQAAFELGITEYTVQVHRGHIMRKMEADSFATLVRLAAKFTTLDPPDDVERDIIGCRSSLSSAHGNSLSSKTIS